MAKKKKMEKNEAVEFMEDTLEGLDLSDKEKEFVLRYLHSYNATQSAMQAYGYNKYQASMYANKILHKPHIQSALKKLKKALSVKQNLFLL